MNNKFGIILGTGLDGIVKSFENRKLIYENKKGVHKKRIYESELKGRKVFLFQGRSHYYEGAGIEQILFNVIKSKEFGIDFLIITNAAGGLNDNFNVSDLMLLDNIIDITGIKLKYRPKALFDKSVIEKIIHLAKRSKIKLHKGTYCATTGPMYETKQEIIFLRKIGADAVGMSTVPELKAASATGITTAAISCITNILKPETQITTTHNDVIEQSKKAQPVLYELILSIIENF
ncbi:MAG: purine-nucleoside phosphorylase [Ignavibacteria bacterium]|nr:purine-nucleoside phosphorylase [Ignavibacteria bacterium]